MAETEKLGMVVNLQDYSVHDGYGIRTLVFLKGCPLQCPWCQNPESIRPGYEIKFQAHLCIGCGKCGEACPRGAILKDKEQRIEREKCDLCLRCTDACPSRALSRVGARMSVDALMKPIVSYKPFYDTSERGGVTLSGGEPTFQPEFSLALLKRCREYGIHTAMETCGYTNYETLEALMAHLDLLLYDIKHMKDEVHKKFTGVSNKRILENLEKISKRKDVECVIRIPLICDFNDDEENVRETAAFVRSLGLRRLDLLAFNELPSGKYKTLGQDWVYKNAKRQPDEVLEKLKGIVADQGLEVTIGGLW